MKHTIQVVTSALFLLLLFGFGLWFLVGPDTAVSTAERRKLQSAPTFSLQGLWDGSYFKGIESYASDQFPLRQAFRTLGAQVRTKLLLQQDVKGLYLVDEVVFKSDYPLQPKNITGFAKKTNALYTSLLQNKAAHYYVSVIPDKGQFDPSPHLKTSAKIVADQFTSQLEGATYIDLFDTLTLTSYYQTDTHWSQDKLFPVMEAFGKAMGFVPPKAADYQENQLAPFYGVYWGQSAQNPPADTLVYLTSPITQAATVENVQNKAITAVYDTAAFWGTDGYDLFLSGGTPFTTITSPKSRTQRELVIFRDSFGSSIAPLFLEEYRKVTLIDLRYLSSALLPELVDVTNKDVLVLYSTLILNSAIQLK